MATPSPAPIIAVESNRYVIQFGGAALAAGAQITSVSGGITFRYRILKVKIFYLDDAVPGMVYHVLVGSTPGGNIAGLPEGQSIFSPYSTTTEIRGSQGTRIMEPMLIVDSTRSYLKVHVQNLVPPPPAGFPVSYAAEITIERL
jgi:hypothetical protein